MTPKRRAFVEEYLVDFNATKAAIRAGYSERTATSQASRLLTFVDILEEIERLKAERFMSLEEAQLRVSRVARFDITPYIEGYGRRTVIRTDKMIEDGYGDLVREVWQTSEGVRVKIADVDDALDKILKIHGAYVSKHELTGKDGEPMRVKVIDYGLDDDTD